MVFGEAKTESMDQPPPLANGFKVILILKIPSDLAWIDDMYASSTHGVWYVFV